jgi:hypothetical protein
MTRSTVGGGHARQLPGGSWEPVRRGPTTWLLPDGTTLINPASTRADRLHRYDWVHIKGGPWQITDLRTTSNSGRVVVLGGHPPLVLGPTQSALVYQILAP